MTFYNEKLSPSLFIMGRVFNFRTMAMQLEEQFKGVIWNKTHNAKCAKIAENFAIGFVRWYDDLPDDYCETNDFSYQHLLEIYKKTL